MTNSLMDHEQVLSVNVFMTLEGKSIHQCKTERL